jgi:hypothetical protein
MHKKPEVVICKGEKERRHLYEPIFWNNKTNNIYMNLQAPFSQIYSARTLINKLRP